MNTLTKLVHMIECAEKNKVETVETPLLLLRVIAIQLYIFGERVEANPETQARGTQATARPMPGSKASGIRKRMNGTVEKRT